MLNLSTRLSTVFYSFSHFRSSEKGATTVETAISAVPFFLIVYGLIGFIHWAHTVITMQFALNQTARWAITGAKLADPVTGMPLSRVESVERMFRQTLQNYGQDGGNVIVTLCPITQPNCASNSVSSAGRHFILRATKPVETFFGLNALTPSASVVIRNEPFN